FQYNDNVYGQEYVERIAKHFCLAIDQVLENQQLEIRQLTLLSEEEKNSVLYEFNDTATEYPKDKTIHQLFEEQTSKTPDYIAIVGNADVEEKKQRREEEKNVGADEREEKKRRREEEKRDGMHLSYRELDEQSNRLAGVLVDKGVQPDAIVGIMMERSVEMIIGIFGILKAGGAYLPIAPDYPRERIEYMLRDSGTKLLVTNDKDSETVRRWEGEKMILESILHHANYLSFHYSSFTIHHSSHLAYIIYTSGTTGQPKGSLIEHRNVVRLLFNDKFQFDFSDRDVWTLFHSFCFDFSVWEMYGALLYGGKLVIVPKMVARDTAEFLELINREAVTVLNQTPSAFYNLINEALNSHQARKKLYIKYVIFGGEALNPLKLKDWLTHYPKTKLINMFGITETTVHVTLKEITEADVEINTGNIGKPIPTLSAYILDRHLKPVPVGVMGEICVGGEGVCRGYLNRVELTKEKFIENPYHSCGRLYRSGDTGRFLENRDMEYLGRIDHQVKIRGFRIELGEIESQLLKFGEIKDAVVLAEETPDEKYLCAYIVADKEFTLTELRTYLSRKLPDYMIPSYFVPLEKIPLTPNGKIDRKALPKPEFQTSESYIAPSDEIEKRLVEIWSDVLGRDELHVMQLKTSIGIDNNFFQLGGHSLNATIIATKIHKAFDVKISLANI
ncbi:MAG TPA: amino acid adenylation domain-containing protein, partial [Candidatus Kapabacteria bacterium]|nr:amino acid adenylation domain-containing protein [Candidatus Kapabacteria bacterium]